MSVSDTKKVIQSIRAVQNGVYKMSMAFLININLVSFSIFLNDLSGQVFTLFILTVAAAEAAIGLAILVCFFRVRGTIAVEDINVMKG